MPKLLAKKRGTYSSPFLKIRFNFYSNVPPNASHSAFADSYSASSMAFPLQYSPEKITLWSEHVPHLLHELKANKPAIPKIKITFFIGIKFKW